MQRCSMQSSTKWYEGSDIVLLLLLFLSLLLLLLLLLLSAGPARLQTGHHPLQAVAHAAFSVPPHPPVLRGSS